MTVAERILVPVRSRGVTASSIACMMLGTPAMTMTLPSMKPGALETGFSTRSAPAGMRAIRFLRLGELEAARHVVGRHHRQRPRIEVDRHIESLGDRIGSDVIVGRTDATGGEQVVVTVAQHIDGGDDFHLVVGDNASLLELDAEPGKMLGKEADVLVLGAAREDLVADDQHGGGNYGRLLWRHKRLLRFG